MDIALTFSQSDIQALACQLLDMKPDPVPRYFILRDLLRRPPDDPVLIATRQEVLRSKWITELTKAQLPNGTWGNFHTRATKLKRRIPTSEHAIRRCLALGLDGSSPILDKTTAYIADHLNGKAQWSDHVEKHDHPGLWAAQIRTISAATLALIEPEHPQISPICQYWAEVVKAAFAGGSYNRAAELARHQELSGVPSKKFYPFHAMYPLIVLSAPACSLSNYLEELLLTTVLNWPTGMYYVYSRSLDQFPDIEQSHFEDWLRAQELLARFTRWKKYAPPILNWIWSQRNSQGFWDHRRSAQRSAVFPISESWRKPANRMIDWSVRVLKLLNTNY